MRCSVRASSVVRRPGEGACPTTLPATAASAPSNRSPTRMRSSPTVASVFKVAAWAAMQVTNSTAARIMTASCFMATPPGQAPVEAAHGCLLSRPGAGLPGSAELVERGHHLVGALDHLRVHLVGPLGRDQAGDLRDDVDVGGLQ